MATRQTSSIENISNYIKNTLIGGLTTLRVGNIYDYELADLSGFPAATITSQEIKGEVLDNTRNKRTYTFSVRIFIDRNKLNFGLEKSEQILRSVADEMVLSIDNDPTLGGNCIHCIPFPAKFGYVDTGVNNVRLVEITLECWDAITWR